MGDIEDNPDSRKKVRDQLDQLENFIQTPQYKDKIVDP